MKFSTYRSVISLRKGQIQKGGRNDQGKITVRHRGGGHKQAFRFINWHRDQKKALIVGFEYDPNRSAPLIKLYHNTDTSIQNKYSYILAPSGAKIFQEVYTYEKNIPKRIIILESILTSQSVIKKEVYGEITQDSALFFCIPEMHFYIGMQFKITPPGNSDDISFYKDSYLGDLYVWKNESFKVLQPGDAATLSFFEPGDFIHAVQSVPEQNSIFSRSAGSFCQVINKVQVKNKEDYSNSEVNKKGYVTLRLPSGSQRQVDSNAKATFGIVSTTFFHSKNLRKAGRSRWLGFRPSVRGVAINPVDHPHGGGQGKTSGGRPSVTFKSWPTKGQPTRNKKRKNILIVTPRTK